MMMVMITLRDATWILFANFMIVFGVSSVIDFFSLSAYFAYSYLAVIVIVFVLIRYADRLKFRGYPIKKFGKKEFRLSLLFILILFPVAFGARLIDPGFDAWYAEQAGLLTVAGTAIFILLLPFFTIGEELIFRGIIQPKLSRHYGSVATIFIISVNFALIHFYIISEMFHIYSSVIAVFFGSLVLAALYEKTKSIIATIITHLIYNIAIAYQIFLHAKDYFLAESVFWAAYALLFLAFFGNMRKELIFGKDRLRMKMMDYLFVGIFILLPLAAYFALR